MIHNTCSRRLELTWIALFSALAFLRAGSADAVGPEALEVEANPCVVGATLATGSPDPAIFAREASRGVRAFWCETYDVDGNSQRGGAYWEIYPGGATRALARYVDSHIEGLVEIFDEDGSLWLRGELVRGEWAGTLEIFHANGAPWLSTHFRDGRLDGPVETRFPDGRVESSTRFQGGREEAVATSYYPAKAGGGLRSRVRVEGDEIVEAEPMQPAKAALSQAALPASPLGHAEN